MHSDYPRQTAAIEALRRLGGRVYPAHRPQFIELQHASFTEADMVHLDALDTSGVTDVYLDKARITDRGLKHLSRFARLQNLSVCDAAITDGGLARLSGFTQLVELNLGGTQVTDCGIPQLLRFSRLEALHLEDTRVSGDGLERLTAMRQLQELGISHTNVDDIGTQHLRAFDYLRSVGLDGPCFGDYALAQAAHLSDLRRRTGPPFGACGFGLSWSF